MFLYAMLCNFYLHKKYWKLYFGYQFYYGWYMWGRAMLCMQMNVKHFKYDIIIVFTSLCMELFISFLHLNVPLQTAYSVVGTLTKQQNWYFISIIHHESKYKLSTNPIVGLVKSRPLRTNPLQTPLEPTGGSGAEWGLRGWVGAPFHFKGLSSGAEGRVSWVGGWHPLTTHHNKQEAESLKSVQREYRR